MSRSTMLPERYSTRLNAGYQTLSVAWLLARRDILTNWRGSRLSVFWPILYPAAYTVLFMALRPILQASADWEARYALHVFIGFSLWQAWFEGLRGQMDALRSNRALLSRSDLTPTALFLFGLLVQLFSLLPRVAVSLVVAVFAVDLHSLLDGFGFVFMSVAVVVNGSVIGFVLQPFAALRPDVGRAIQSVSLALLVSGGIFMVYPEHLSSTIVNALAVNPLGPLVEAARSCLIERPRVFEWSATIWCVLTAIAVALQIRFTRKVLPLVLERVGG